MDSEFSHFVAPTSEEPPNLLLDGFYLLLVDGNCSRLPAGRGKETTKRTPEREKETKGKKGHH
jgi:hypothetical protein